MVRSCGGCCAGRTGRSKWGLPGWWWSAVIGMGGHVPLTVWSPLQPCVTCTPWERSSSSHGTRPQSWNPENGKEIRANCIFAALGLGGFWALLSRDYHLVRSCNDLWGLSSTSVVFLPLFIVLGKATGADVVYFWEAAPSFWTLAKQQQSSQSLKIWAWVAAISV